MGNQEVFWITLRQQNMQHVIVVQF
jgi:hypothetical protein